MSILKGLKDILGENLIPLHMPGHKGRVDFPKIMDRMQGMDITEIPGSDNLHHAQGMILEAQKKAASIFGAQRTYFLVNGTTVGIQAMILSHCKPGDKLLVPRNGHRSIWSALILGGIHPVYITPEYHPQTGIGLSISPETVEEKLRVHPDVKGAVLTYPTFYGTCSDIRRIAELLHQNNSWLLVDEAHGAHFAFHRDLPITALEGGGDIVVQSTHKLLSSLTQSSMLHVGNERCSLDDLAMFLGMLQSSSPSYPLMASLEFAALQAEKEGAQRWNHILAWNQRAYKIISRETPFLPVGKELIGSYGVVDYDLSRLLIDVSPAGLSGIEVEEGLRKHCGIQVELSDDHYILAMTGMGTQEKDIHRFTNALIDIYNHSKGIKRKRPSSSMLPIYGDMVLSPRDAIYAKEEEIPFEESSGRISKEFFIPYPPGIPMVLPGERITKDIIDAIKEIKSSGGRIIGPYDPSFQRIRVVKDI